MSFAAGRPVLAIPGPSPVPDRVLRAMNRPSPDIYAGEAVEMNLRAVAGLKRLAGTTGNVAPYIGNGHAAWEAVIANLLTPGEKALALASGHFGRGFAEAARSMGVDVEMMDFGNRAAPDPAQLAARLAADKGGEIRAVLVCQVDTASGVRADIPALRAAMGDHPAAFVVDAIASLGCEELRMDDWGVDALVASSQKGLMLPPGLAFVWFTDRVRGRGRPSQYLDWSRRTDATELWQFWGGTPPVQHIYGLAEVLTMMLDDETLPAIWARHDGLAHAVWAAVDAWAAGGDMALNVADPAARARSVTAVHLRGADDLRRWTETKAGVTLGVGLAADPPGSAFRIAHMGHCGAHMVLGTLAAIQAGLSALNIPHGAGALDAATAVIAAKA